VVVHQRFLRRLGRLGARRSGCGHGIDPRVLLPHAIHRAGHQLQGAVVETGAAAVGQRHPAGEVQLRLVAGEFGDVVGAPLGEALARAPLRWHARHPATVNALLFLLTIQIATVFFEARTILAERGAARKVQIGAQLLMKKKYPDSVKKALGTTTVPARRSATRWPSRSC